MRAWSPRWAYPAPPESTSGWEEVDDAWITPTECVDLLVDAEPHGERRDPTTAAIATAIHALGRARPATRRRPTDHAGDRRAQARTRPSAASAGAHEGGRRS